MAVCLLLLKHWLSRPNWIFYIVCLLVVRFIRECSKDYHYKDMTIPAGTAVVIADFLVLKDPQYWDDPERFDPLR